MVHMTFISNHRAYIYKWCNNGFLGFLACYESDSDLIFKQMPVPYSLLN